MLYQVKKDCMTAASKLGDYQSMSVDELANGYCKAIDEQDADGMNTYLGALLLRFWYRIDKLLHENLNYSTDRTEYFDWLYEAINYACKYRAWQDPTKKVNAQQAINQCIGTIRLQHYYVSNLKKNRGAYGTQVYLDDTFGDDGNKTLLDTIESDEVPASDENHAAEDLIQYYIEHKKLVEAIILDTIAFNDCQKHIKKTIKTVDEEGNPVKYNEYSHEFWPYRVVHVLNSLPEDYFDYFVEKYEDVIPQEFEAALASIRKSNNKKLYKSVEKTLAGLRENKDLMAMFISA
jgi:hypothetical protein